MLKQDHSFVIDRQIKSDINIGAGVLDYKLLLLK